MFPLRELFFVLPYLNVMDRIRIRMTNKKDFITEPIQMFFLTFGLNRQQTCYIMKYRQFYQLFDLAD
jgi:hypothetical protein